MSLWTRFIEFLSQENFLIFEPNKLNPALFLMCVFDRNEWGLLSLGSKKRYREVLREIRINEIDYMDCLLGQTQLCTYDSGFFITAKMDLGFVGYHLKFLSQQVANHD